jgi:predicted DNA-binding transcriptional regulator YafY
VTADLSPTARALRVLDLLHNRPGIGAAELAGRLGVSERAARRYVSTLREAGIPVESERGPYGGYRLGRGTRLPPVLFTQAEALGLVMAVLDGQPAASDVDDPVGSALGKVIRALPETVGRQAAVLREHASATPERRPTRPDPGITSALVDAVAARQRVRVSYRSESGHAWDAEVDPWAVVVRYGRWYLLCHSHQADATRTYRIDRVGAVRPTPHTFRPPDGLDPVASLEQHLGIGWEFPTRVVFDAPLDQVAHWVPRTMGRLEESEPGCVLVGSTSNPAMYAAEWLARVPLAFRVEGGPELVDAVAAVAGRLSAAVGDHQVGGTGRDAD